MKNLIVSLATVLVTGVTPALANGSDRDPRFEKAFTQNFTGAENIKWAQLEDGYKSVFFTLNGVGVEAFYNRDAELVGTARNLFYNQLPLLVIQSVNNKFKDAVVLEAKEITNGDGTQYKITLEEGDKTYLVKVGSGGNITDKQRIRK
jgi:hypothetical protein